MLVGAAPYLDNPVVPLFVGDVPLEVLVLDLQGAVDYALVYNKIFVGDAQLES